MDLLELATSLSEIPYIEKNERVANLSAANNGIGCALVKDDGQIIGIFTDGDFRRTVTNNQTQDLRVKDVMTPNPISMPYSTPLPSAFATMVTRKINHLLLRDEKGHYVGLIDFHQIAATVSPEQMYIDTDNRDYTDNENRHVARYKFASNFFKAGDRVLDGACGCGYGSHILSATGADVLSVDLNDKAINYARNRYGVSASATKGSIEFRKADLTCLSIKDKSLDGVVSLETLEHIDLGSCRNYLKNIAGWIKPGGILVASSPMLRYKNGKPFITNPYHINEQPKEALLGMFKELLGDFRLHFFHQKEEIFLPLDREESGFCLLLARRKGSGK